MQRFSARDRLARLPEKIRQIEEAVLSVVARAATAKPVDRDGCDVESLKAWLASRAHRRIRISELAVRAGVSLRTVQQAFLRTGATPIDYLRRVRLDRARAILAGPMEGVTVADAAAAVGYSHLGRFAEEYRRHVGELPSRKLARRRHRRD